jgi:hypothetical protein
MKNAKFSYRQPDDQPPPFLRTWPRVYLAVLCYSFALMLLLYVLSRLFGR